MLVVVVFVLAACAPAAAHIYSPSEGGDNVVTAVPGAQPVGQVWTDNLSHTTNNYVASSWVDTRPGGADKVSRFALRVQGSGSMNGMYGGFIAYADNSTNWDDWHYRSGLEVEQPSFVADRLTVVNEGDGVKNAGNGSDFRLAHSWINGTHDDCFQGDYGLGGVVLESNLFQDCYSGISANPVGVIDASGTTLVLDRNIISVSDKASCYDPTRYGCPNHAGWLKWDENRATAQRLALWNNTFVAFSYPSIGNLALGAPIATTGTNTPDCYGTTLDYMGPLTGADGVKWRADLATWRADCPTGLNVHTGAKALINYYARLSEWHATYDQGLG